MWRLAAMAAFAFAPAAGAGNGTTAIALSRPVVVYGGAVRLSGTFGHGLPGQAVTVYAREYRQPFRLVGIASTGPGGTWTYTVRPAIQTSFEASSLGDASRSPLVFVRPRVVFAARGRGFFAEAAAGRPLDGKVVRLQRRVGRRWATIKLAVLGSRARVFRVRLPHGLSRLRIFVPRAVAGPGYLDGFSPTIAVRR